MAAFNSSETAASGGLHLFGGHFETVKSDALKTLDTLSHRSIAPTAYVGEQRRYRIGKCLGIEVRSLNDVRPALTCGVFDDFHKMTFL